MKANKTNKVKQDLLTIFHAAIDAVAGKQVVKNEFKQNKPTTSKEKYHIIAIGKAADSMLQGVPDKKIIDGIVISKHGHISQSLKQDTRFTCIESDHPIPKQASIDAGKKLISYLRNLPPNNACLFLISGGTSSLVEVLHDGWTLQDLSELSNYLLANAFPINEINAIRRKTSKIKGGGLWHYLDQRPVSCLLISDVPDNNPADVGSGLLFSASLPEENQKLPKLPQKWLSKLKPEKKIKPPNDFNWKIIASLENAKQAAAQQAKKLNYKTQVIPDFLHGIASEVAKDCVKTLKQNPATLFIWGGETTVLLPKNPGKGGRNQHLALAAAIQINKMENCYLLAAGTDGSDGLSSATGALVDSQTLNKAHKKNLDAQHFLRNANSNTFLQATDSLIITGETGTNVMDLIIAIRNP